jgi:hypothetical protein
MSAETLNCPEETREQPWRWDRRIRIAAALGSIVCGAFVLIAPLARDVARAGVYPATQVVRMPTAKRGAKVGGSARVWNLGFKPLRIHELPTECDCSAAVLKDWVIPPFSSVPVQLTVDTHRMKGDYSKRVMVEVTPMAPEAAVIHLQGMVTE